MDLELKHLGQTLAVGGFAIFGFFHMISLCKRRWVPAFPFSSEGAHKLHESAMILALIFATGILLEDVSKNIVAERWPISPLFNYILDTDRELRLRSLFEVNSQSAQHIDIKPNGIYDELSETRHDDTIFQYYWTKVQSAIKSDPKVNKGRRSEIESYTRINGDGQVRDFQAWVNGIFYAAKNHVYGKDTYYGELDDIEKRIDFTRSLTAVCMLYSFMYFLLLALSFIKPLAAFLGVNKAERKIALLICLTYAAGTLLSRSAYQTEQSSYNRRVFGYYNSLQQTQ
jgi:hypothetical protein